MQQPVPYPVKAFNYSFPSKGLPSWATEYHRQDARRLIAEMFQLDESLVRVTPSDVRSSPDGWQLTGVTGPNKTCQEASILAAQRVLPRLRALQALNGRESPWPTPKREEAALIDIASGRLPCSPGSLERFYIGWQLGLREPSQLARLDVASAAEALAFRVVQSKFTGPRPLLARVPSHRTCSSAPGTRSHPQAAAALQQVAESP